VIAFGGESWPALMPRASAAARRRARNNLLDDHRAAAPVAEAAIKHTTRVARALVKDIQYRLDVDTLHRDQETKELGLNEIGRVQLCTTVPLLCDPYSKNRTTG
jgi:sulfate adenylyltransferase subunit 1 (EFTu-like GTPase family)